MRNSYGRNSYGLFALLFWTPVLWAVDASILEPDRYQEHIALTIYNQNFGIVKDQRKVRIQKNPDTIQFDNVAKQIQETTVRFRSLTDPHATVLEQYYAYDLSSPDRLLQKYINKPLTVSLKDGSHYTGNLLHFDSGTLILQEGEKGEQGEQGEKSPTSLTMIPREHNVKDIHIHFTPYSQVFMEPTLLWNIATDQLGDQWVEASYETTGLNWQAHYNVSLHSQDTIMDLQALVTLYNESGATYKDVALKLVAGETHRNPQPMPMMATAQVFSRGQNQNQSAFHEEAFSEYHLYTLDHPITVANNQTKQIKLFETFDVPIKKIFMYEGAPHVYWGGERDEPITDANYGNEEGNKKVQVKIKFKNSLEDHMGMPLPKGTVRLYKKDPTDGTYEFIGEDTIDHTPKNKKVRLTIGYAFDIGGHRKRTDFQVDLGRRVMMEAFEIELQNHKDSPIEVLVKEPLYRWNSWEIISSSIPYEKYDANTIQFHVPVEKNGKQVLTYTVRYAW